MNTDELADAVVVAERRVLSIQTKLHCWARDDPHRRFDDLFNLVADPAFLLIAWVRVRGNRGAKTAGVDGRTALSIAATAGVEGFLDTLRAAVKDRSFRPLPVRERLIPKANGKFRRLGIATISDRVVQASLKLVLEPILSVKSQLLGRVSAGPLVDDASATMTCRASVAGPVLRRSVSNSPCAAASWVRSSRFSV